ncbi:hypothetical protein SAY87_030502 [Trapa incisa]|uniref:O-fucosyltransferase family protein n=1 Tax=Trapa incisa TaxID=236973 RepID=A0AAN7QN83_9MYRT|nr:hypothetical protein SAY87_030502 [Trapa incisa]
MGRQGSPRSPRPELQNENLLSGSDPPIGRRITAGDWNKGVSINGFKNEPAKACVKGGYAGKRQNWLRRCLRNFVFMLGLTGLIFMYDSFMVSFMNYVLIPPYTSLPRETSNSKEDGGIHVKEEKHAIEMYGRLLDLASAALRKKEDEQGATPLWEEPYDQASHWKPCSDQRLQTSRGNAGQRNGYILVSANGGLNQQRVAICNAVAVASLLNATLVIPRFLYSNVWKDPSQFSDIYQKEYFVKALEDDIEIVMELPPHLKSLDVEAIGSQITDADLDKEASPADYLRIVLPLLLKHGVVHFLGFGNRLGFDPVPFHLQRLRCKCNFHALKFAPKIQEVGALLVSRIRRFKAARSSVIDMQILGSYAPVYKTPSPEGGETSKYLAMHLRFEEDMVAYSKCEFGGGEGERKELQAYRESHFPLLMERLKNAKHVSPGELRMLGRCPLTPEEAALLLASLGIKQDTRIYLAGSHVYGGESRMRPLTGLYPNLATKETLLTPIELSPFTNFSSQLAALDFIACVTADMFTMTDSGSQLSSLVSGFRAYYGEGRAPILRPNKKRLAAIMSENGTISWNSFKQRIRKMVEEGQKVRPRRFGRSIYRQPRCPQCMCSPTTGSK